MLRSNQLLAMLRLALLLSACQPLVLPDGSLVTVEPSKSARSTLTA